MMDMTFYIDLMRTLVLMTFMFARQSSQKHNMTSWVWSFSIRFTISLKLIVLIWQLIYSLLTLKPSISHSNDHISKPSFRARCTKPDLRHCNKLAQIHMVDTVHCTYDIALALWWHPTKMYMYQCQTVWPNASYDLLGLESTSYS